MSSYPYQVGPEVVWPGAEFVVRAWLVEKMPGVNIRTETNATFGTSSADPTMTLPLVLLEQVPGGSIDEEGIDSTVSLDVSCFAATRLDAWNLYNTTNAWMLRLTSQTTSFGAVDEVTVENGAGVVNYNNPDLRRVVVTYRLATRAQTVL